MNHKEKCGDYDICTIGASLESHLHWKDQFQKNSLHFRVIADFETDNKIDNSSIGKKTATI